ncbi:hypothetical protein P152DRAFT_284453 [Eremomyces bilateralis CBS 781.70]|uniref:Uncharacterized protein n=1 Tax=Eremomyces bilateralis CBS 781.70 TaxID=1392243 RepID=A0A6G1FQB8_9PEZI|nr:uncharacterized protein P152DRAFT_284453 [Eremomyces bilateralis CBS 781.70]KAF1807900.1 hypothetical protein P152DRAFT_284453 [Eremomyces bilateralis CBS 781.70]
MSRLSRITFVFLPLLFISGLFGMNVDVLKVNPPWWWYIVFAVVALALTMTVWIIFKRYPNVRRPCISRVLLWSYADRFVNS